MESLYKVTFLPFELYSQEEFNLWESIVFENKDQIKTKEIWLQMAHYYLTTEEYLNAQVCLMEVLKLVKDPYANFLMALIINLKGKIVDKKTELPEFVSVSTYHLRDVTNNPDYKLNCFEDYLIESIDLGYYHSMRMIPKMKGHYKRRLFENKFKKWETSIRETYSKKCSEKCYFLWLLCSSFKPLEKHGRFKININIKDALELAIKAESTEAIFQYYFFAKQGRAIYYPLEKTKTLNKICETHLEKLILIKDRITLWYLFNCSMRTSDSIDQRKMLFDGLEDVVVDKWLTCSNLADNNLSICWNEYLGSITSNNFCHCKTQIEKGKYRMIYSCTLCCGDKSDEKYHFNKKILKNAARKKTLLELVPSLKETFWSLAWSYDNQFYNKLYDYQLYFEFLEYAYCTAHFYRTPEKNIIIEILDIRGCCTPFNVKPDEEDVYAWTLEDYPKSLISLSNLVNPLVYYIDNKISKYSRTIHNLFGDDFLDEEAESGFKRVMRDILYQNNVFDAITDEKIISITHDQLLGIGNEIIQRYARVLNIGFELVLKYINIMRTNIEYVPGHSEYERAKTRFENIAKNM